MSQAKDLIEQLMSAAGATNGSGGRGSGARRASGPGGGQIAVIIGIVALAWGAFSSFYTVQPEERAVVKRFGRVIGITDPGLHFKLPFGLDEVQLVATERVLKQEFGFRTEDASPFERTRFADQDFPSESLMLTGDLNIIQVEWVVQYRIGDPILFLYGMREPTGTLRDLSESVMRRVVGNRIGSDVRKMSNPIGRSCMCMTIRKSSPTAMLENGGNNQSRRESLCLLNGSASLEGETFRQE